MNKHSRGTSEKSPLLTSGSRITAEQVDVTFHDSATSDLDTSSRYGSLKGGNSYASATSILHPCSSHLRLDPTATTVVDLSAAVHRKSEHRATDDGDMLPEDEAYGTTNQTRAEGDFIKGFFAMPMQDQLKLSPCVSRIIKPKQNSLVTIFSIWNTILGSSMLTMPWGIFMAGLIPAIVLILAMSGLCLYTAHKILQIHKYHGGGERIEVIELSRTFLGPWAENAAKIFSISVLLGANITYWILMSNFLYNSVNFFYDFIAGIPLQHMSNELKPEIAMTVRCPKEEIVNGTRLLERSYGNLGPGWDLYRTVPLFLALLIFPVLNFNTTTFFTKFNALGTASIVYLIVFVLVKSSTWGVHMTGTALDVIWELRPSFPALSGMLALSFFIHNIIITIMQSNHDQKKNGRDLTIAYILVTLTYFIVGVAFYICFPLAKSCIEDNLLNNFQTGDGLTVGARVVLFFQLFTVFPLIAYMLRIQLLSSVFKTAECARSSVLFVNAVMVGICVLFAVFMPYIGTIIRFTGAMSGLVYVFTLPSLFHIVISHRRGTATVLSTCLHAAITVIGVLNLACQFFIREG